ncbi:hypothetical protein [Desertivirga xinjiangensis]|uniref:hypothetical protein n=1 Tax=Desertivirga xinjiangensis TaxID=539206 RepID=UPI00210C84CE|nr:hypothetical protein [Pedobacter xinjiangensis]
MVPNLAYFVTDNTAIGAGFGYNYSKLGEASPTGQNEFFVIRPFARYYVTITDNKIKGAGNEILSIGTNFFTPHIGVQFHF